MTRLVDRFRAGPVSRSSVSKFSREKHAEWVRNMRDDLDLGAPVIVIDNVADYVLGADSRDRWDAADIPNAAPPWRLAWYEFKVPRDNDNPLLSELAWWVDAQDRDEGGWTLHCWPWSKIRSEKDVVGPMGGHTVEVAADGSLERFTPMSFEGWSQEMAYGTLIYLIPVLMANAFAHCRNVREESVTPPERLSRSHRRRHGTPLTKYSVLVIDPMREVLRREGRSENFGTLRALHICRGHFKTFNEKPLFGKLHGMYWWSPQIRGKGESGRVVKAYRVHASEEGGVEAEVRKGLGANGSSHTTPARAREVELFSVDRAIDYLRFRYPGTEIEALSHSNPGYDIRIGPPDDPIRYVEVKGTTTGEPVFFLTENERQFSVEHADRYTMLLLADIDLDADTFELHLHEGAIDARFSLDPVQWRGSFPE